MKRSKAIAIISNFVYELNVEPDECDEESNKILTALEEAGMLPPRYTKHLTDEEAEEYPDEPEVYFLNEINLNEWEEDET